MLDIDTIGNYRKRYEAVGVSGLLKNNYFDTILNSFKTLLFKGG